MMIRLATPEDAEALLMIYAPYVQKTAITFEYEVPTLEEFKERIKAVLKKYPYLVALEEGRIIGYAYVSPFKSRAAYDWAVETSIYIDENHKGNGAGKELYLALETLLKAQHIINMNACIAYPNPGSVAFHEKLGYAKVAHFTKCGYKFETWYDMIWMEKMIGDHHVPPKTIKSIDEINVTYLLSMLQ